MAKKKSNRIMKTSKEVIHALRNKYPSPEWAFLEQVANTTGYANYRWADAIAMNLWPSRKYELIGFEVKVNRTDWRRELKKPQKADAIATYCDSWYLVLGDENILKFGELPAGWGLMVPHTKNSLKIVKKSQMLKPKPLDKHFIAAMLRKACKQITEDAQLHREFDRGYDEGLKAGKEENKFNKEMKDKEIGQLRKKIDDFRTVSGVDIDDWRYHAKDIGRAVKTVLNGSYQSELKQLENLLYHAERCVSSIEREIEKHKQIQEDSSASMQKM